MNLKPGIAAVDPSVDDVDGNVLTQPGKRLWTFRFRALCPMLVELLKTGCEWNLPSGLKPNFVSWVFIS